MSTLTDSLNTTTTTTSVQQNSNDIITTEINSKTNNNGNKDIGVVTVSAESAVAAVATVTIPLTATTTTIDSTVMQSTVTETTGVINSPPILVPVTVGKSVTATTTTSVTSAVVSASTVKVNNGPMTSPTTTGMGTTGGPPPLLQNRSQDVRVDNWGNYCLQRLQVMYKKGDFTDLTLQFSNQEIVKVHRVVVNLCTEYFANLERLFGLTDGILVLPKDIDCQTMTTIIKFFYTGKLEVRGNQFNDVYRTVKLMNITILTKLLEAHAKKPVAQTQMTTQVKKEQAAATRPIVFKQPMEIGGRPLTKIQLTSAQAASLLPGGALNKKLMSRQFPPGVKTKTVLARVQAQPGTTRQQAHVSGLGNISIIRTSAPKKLPIWKERKYAPVIKQEPRMPERWQKEEEPARPTRFEWADPEEESNYMTTTTTSFMERQKAASAVTKAAKDIFDAVVKNQAQSQAQVPPQPQGLKRTIANTYTDIKVGRSDTGSASASKISKISMDIEKELAEMEGIEVDHDDNDNSETISSNTTQIMVQQPLPIPSMKYEARPIQRASPQAHTTGIMKSSAIYPNTPQNLRRNLVDRKGEKTVRFAPEVEKENKTRATAGSTGTPHSTEATSSSTPTLVIPSDDSSTPTDLLSNHSKIISEVLKKYPQLVKDNKNIKLKIVQKGANDSSGSGAGASSKSKVSYIVLKSTSSPDSPGSVVLKKPGALNKSSPFWDTPEKTARNAKISQAEENIKGPWLCSSCLVDDVPTEFESYFAYRRHLVEIHGERIDARICEYCGYKASKRNLLLYHMYTKHGVDPPKNVKFPHCDRCDYVALSESLMVKHRIAHDSVKEVSCTICNVSFKSNAALHSHNVANLHRNNDTKDYECPYCRKTFVRNITLKAHIRSLHREIARVEEMDDPNLPPVESLMPLTRTSTPAAVMGKKSRPNMSRPAQVLLEDHSQEQEVHSESYAHGMGQVSLMSADGQTIEILHRMDPSMSDGSTPISLVPSSEADSMNNVANSIVASLGLDTHGQQIGVGPEYDGSQAVYIMDSSNQAVEVNMSGIEMAADGSMIIGGDDGIGSGQFIVQDMQGNQFQRMTGIDENGKQVIFFQLSDEHGQITMAPTMLDESGQIMNAGEGTVVQQYEFDPNTGQPAFNVQNDHMYLDPQKCSVFVSSGGVTMPGTVSAASGISGHHSHMVLTSTPDGNQLIEMVPIQSGSHEEILHHHHQQQSPDMGESSHQEQQPQMQELHLVLDQQSVGMAQEVELSEGDQQGNEHHEEEGMYVEMEEVEADQGQNDVEVTTEGDGEMQEQAEDGEVVEEQEHEHVHEEVEAESHEFIDDSSDGHDHGHGDLQDQAEGETEDAEHLIEGGDGEGTYIEGESEGQGHEEGCDLADEDGGGDFVEEECNDLVEEPQEILMVEQDHQDEIHEEEEGDRDLSQEGYSEEVVELESQNDQGEDDVPIETEEGEPSDVPVPDENLVNIDEVELSP